MERRIGLRRIAPGDEERIREYVSSYSSGMRITYNEDRIPGLDGLDRYSDISSFIEYTLSMEGKVLWFLSERKCDGKVIGALVLRLRLEYDEDDEEFASNIGYSIRDDERGKGYATEQLELGLEEASKAGLKTVRLICRDVNTGSRRTIEKCGGRLIDSITGEESGLTVLRYDIDITGD